MSDKNKAAGGGAKTFAFEIQRTTLMALAGRAVATARRNKMSTTHTGSALLEVRDDATVRVSATDLDTTIVGTASATVSATGAALVPVAMLFDAAKVLPGDVVSVEGREHEITLRCGRVEMAVVCSENDGYPRLPVAPMTMNEVDGVAIGALLKAVLFSASHVEGRPNLCGVYLQPLGAPGDVLNLRGVTTDGHRLSQHTAHAGAGIHAAFGDMPGVILPLAGANDLVRLIGEMPVTGMALADNNIVFRSQDGAVTLFVRQIDAHFPDYQQVVPKGAPNHVVTMERDRMRDALGRMRVAADGRTNGIKLTFGTDLAGGLMAMELRSPDKGRAYDELPCDWRGDDFVIMVNLPYLREAVDSLHSDKVTLRLNEPLSPLVVVGHDNDPLADPAVAPNDLRIIMPMRI